MLVGIFLLDTFERVFVGVIINFDAGLATLCFGASAK